MKRVSFVVVSACVLALGLSASAREQVARAAARQAAPATPAVATNPQPASPKLASQSASEGEQTALVKQYCATCHNDRNKNNAGGLSLVGFDAAKVGHDAQVAEVAEK